MYLLDRRVRDDRSRRYRQRKTFRLGIELDLVIPPPRLLGKLRQTRSEPLEDIHPGCPYVEGFRRIVGLLGKGGPRLVAALGEKSDRIGRVSRLQGCFERGAD
jgi:hypothetical protein